MMARRAAIVAVAAAACVFLSGDVAHAQDERVILVAYSSHTAAFGAVDAFGPLDVLGAEPDACLLSTRGQYADTFRVDRGTTAGSSGAGSPFLGNTNLKWADGRGSSVDWFGWGCGTGNETQECHFVVTNVGFGTCFTVKGSSNYTLPAGVKNYSSYTLYKQSEESCAGIIDSGVGDEVAIASFTGNGCTPSATSSLKSRLQLYPAATENCSTMPGPLVPTESAAPFTQTYQITQVPSVLQEAPSFVGELGCAAPLPNPISGDCGTCQITIRPAVKESTCVSVTYPGVGSIKFGASTALSQCPGSSSAQSEWDKYGWEITAVGLWFVAVIGAALIIRGCHKLGRQKRNYMSLNDEVTEDGDGVYQSSLQRSGNGRVGMGRIRQEITNQEQALSASSAQPTTGIAKAERALAARANNGKGALLPPNTNKKAYG